ncbi:CidA/LrgA family protein [Pseudoalteromonas tunicata]|jgi:holin-like protein|uniref:Putative effector of murein hydrolase LrgA n=1 Tax=Pseudoalteromonas tunicata D2 TaxID=87626 RepID=A4CCH4_9GAMM|nr:CidA/LrgA family protein [Pseudoalteromonas tunicata]ATC93768.1 hypothetical protein PTUN_a1075 [Pseudoalteromonas tunicata]AXT29590.1 CidA/LrgA family protein [Pseudoalteromonas tunicata]EAR27267.1 putative effector of murein hydrolase LrgA [Pseudoalteromonas tunicata D2]MDP4985098.1 CidA/LrgA family protein [Pseudoalteromonas tunicata]
MKYILSSALILSCLLIGKGASWLLNGHFPGAIFGMLLLFLLLVSGKVHYDSVYPAGSLLLKYLPILFIPAGVGLIEHLALLEQAVWAISLAVLCSTLITLAAVGHFMQKRLQS